MMRSTRQATRAANKARLSGKIVPDPPKNTKIAFPDDDDDDHVDDLNVPTTMESHPMSIADTKITKEDEKLVLLDDTRSKNNKDEEDDVVEEMTGSAARAYTQKSRDAERTLVKESSSKKKRRKKEPVLVEDNKSKTDDEGPRREDHSDDDDDNDDDEDDMSFTDDFFQMVDSERASLNNKTKQEKKRRRIHQKRLMGKHTTFVVDGDYNTVDVPYSVNANIEVIALGEVGESETYANDERQLLTSAALGVAPSKGAISFARGYMPMGTSKERSSDSGRKRKSKDEETWKRSKKMNFIGAGHRPGRPAALFVRNKK